MKDKIDFTQRSQDRDDARWGYPFRNSKTLDTFHIDQGLSKYERLYAEIKITTNKKRLKKLHGRLNFLMEHYPEVCI